MNESILTQSEKGQYGLMRHDEAFKVLLQARPGDVIEAFAPELIVLYGPAASVQVESVELLPRVKGLRRSRFVDFAVTVRWPGADQRAVLVLTEHFSAPAAVELSRVALYTAAMMNRHPGVPVLPVVVVARTRGRALADHLLNQVAGLRVLEFRCRLFPVDTDCLPAWDRTRSPLLAVLAALMRDQPAVRVAYRSVQHLRASHDGMGMLAQLLPLIETLASLTHQTQLQFRTLLTEEPEMISVVDMFRAEGEAKGKAEGKAEGEAQGKAETILSLVLDGLLPRTTAEIRLRHLHDQGQIGQDLLRTTLERMSGSRS